MVVADTHEHAKHAARKVYIKYEELPALLSIEDAIASNSFHPHTEKCLRKGDVDLCFLTRQCDKIIEGEVQVGGQEHFYLEPHSTLIWTTDGGNEVHMISSTQVSFANLTFMTCYVPFSWSSGGVVPVLFLQCPHYNYGRRCSHHRLFFDQFVINFG